MELGLTVNICVCRPQIHKPFRRFVLPQPLNTPSISCPKMVLQDRYARAASRRYQRTHAPTPEQAAEHAAVDAALREAEMRRLGKNAERYREWDEEEKGERRDEDGDGKERVFVEEEIDEEEGALLSCRRSILDPDGD